MDILHVDACEMCRDKGVVDKDCYFHGLRRCATHGFNPQYESEIKTEYNTSGNNKLSQVFAQSR